MRLDGHEQSSNVEDRRGRRGPAMAAGGGGLLLVILMIVMNVMGVDRGKQQAIIGVAKGIQERTAQAPAEAGEGVNDEARVFISILKSTENVWTKLFKEQVEAVATRLQSLSSSAEVSTPDAGEAVNMAVLLSGGFSGVYRSCVF